MSGRLHPAVFLFLTVPLLADEPVEKKSMKEQINALVLDDFKNGSAPKSVQLSATAGSKLDESHPVDRDGSGEPVVVLPKVVVEAERITKLKQEIAKQDALIAQETKHTVPTGLDSVVNAPVISFKLFGGLSSDVRAADAKHRVKVMGWEKIVLIAIAEAKTEKEKEEWRKMLREMHGYRQ